MGFTKNECGIHTPRDELLPLDEEKMSDEIEAYENHPEVKQWPETVVGVECRQLEVRL